MIITEYTNADKTELPFPTIDKYILYPIAHKIIPIFYKLGLVPNYVTIGNMILRLYIYYRIYYGYINNITLFLLFLTQLLDSCDGAMARKYKMATKLGDLLDHISDGIFWPSLLILVMYKSRNLKKEFIICSSIFIFEIFTHIQCHFFKRCTIASVADSNSLIYFYIIFNIFKKCNN